MFAGDIRDATEYVCKQRNDDSSTGTKIAMTILETITGMPHSLPCQMIQMEFVKAFHFIDVFDIWESTYDVSELIFYKFQQVLMEITILLHELTF